MAGDLRVWIWLTCGPLVWILNDCNRYVTLLIADLSAVSVVKMRLRFIVFNVPSITNSKSALSEGKNKYQNRTAIPVPGGCMIRFIVLLY